MLSLPTNRLLILLSLTLLVATWWYAALLESRGAQLARDIAAHRAPTEAYDQVPLSPAPARTAAQRLLVSDAADPARIDDLLAYSLSLRPIYAPYWLDRAEAAYQAGDMPAAEAHLATATNLWPTRPTLLWKAAMLQARLGNADEALAVLKSYLHAEPNGYRETVAVASRLAPDPGNILRAILPAGDPYPGRITRDDLVWRILRIAGAANNTGLGRAAWAELTPAARETPEIARHYVEWMVAAEEGDEALAVWSGYRGFDPLPLLENGGFEDAPRGGLGWRVNDRGTPRIARDRHVANDGRFSLRITFPGNENLNFQHVRQYLPVQPGSRYTLRYDWRGDAVSTRSGPYVEVRAPNEGRLAAGQGKWGTWDWESESVEFTVPESVRFAEVWIRRNPTSDLDNEIAGVLWLDNFRLAAAGGEASN